MAKITPIFSIILVLVCVSVSLLMNQSLWQSYFGLRRKYF